MEQRFRVGWTAKANEWKEVKKRKFKTFSPNPLNAPRSDHFRDECLHIYIRSTRSSDLIAATALYDIGFQFNRSLIDSVMIYTTTCEIFTKHTN